MTATATQHPDSICMVRGEPAVSHPISVLRGEASQVRPRPSVNVLE